jgi:CubicO group peptidase (beta-lactamase class C family)
MSQTASTQSSRFETAFALVEAAATSGLVPGAAVAVLRPGERAEVRVFGNAQVVPEKRPLGRDSVFDLASLTKVLFTTSEVLRLVEDGLADLDDPIGRHLPEMAWMQGSPVNALSLRSLLTHSSGLPAWRPIYTWGENPDTLKARVLQEAWPLGENVYSDINFILLGLVIERLRGGLVSDRPLGEGLTFHPRAEQAVATENCPWRGRVLRGETHDENAFALGGAAGHAGLFGTIDGVIGVARGLLEGTLLAGAAIAELRRPQTATRALGWERRNPGWSGGSLCSPETIGHTGYTGTGCWIDFERQVAWVLLSNRVHPSRHTAPDLGPLRRALGNAVSAAV